MPYALGQGLPEHRNCTIYNNKGQQMELYVVKNFCKTKKTIHRVMRKLQSGNFFFPATLQTED